MINLKKVMADHRSQLHVIHDLQVKVRYALKWYYVFILWSTFTFVCKTNVYRCYWRYTYII